MKPRAQTRTRVGIYRLLRISAPVALASQLGIRLVFPTPAILPDLVIFNAAAFLAAASAYFSPLFNDRWSAIGISTALGIWALGSTLSTAESFLAFHIWRGFSDITYALFYPLMLLGLIRAFSATRRLKAVELLDVAIIGLGATSALASLLLRPAMLRLDGSPQAVFLAILYPIGDIVLLVIVLIAMWMQKISLRSLALLMGVVLFTASDLHFIFASATTGYQFAALYDDGWVAGLILISEAMWHHGKEREINPKLMSGATLASLLLSGVLLGLSVMHPSNLPTFVLIPAFATLALSFVRMSIALREAREIKDERALARTDELTGLPNRRRFINALDSLKDTEALLLLMDLDGFKTINDTLGHDAGDALLRQIALRFARQIPKNAILARLGGDEFGAIIYGSTREGIEIAHAIRASLAYPAELGTHTVTMSVSIGAVANDAKPELMKRADKAMYQAKRSGSGVTLVEL
jgi:diguanylate cyclase